MLIARRNRANSAPPVEHRWPTGFADRDWEAEVRLNERNRIARELHDSTSQLIVALQVQLMRLKQSSCVSKSDVFDDVMAELDGVIAELHEGVRKVSASEKPEGGSLGQALAGMASDFARRTGVPVETRIDRMADQLSSRVAGALFRVSQEALANAWRHAKPTQVSLSLTGDSRSVTLRVADNGIGFRRLRRGTRSGRGLTNMKTRLDELGGRLTLRNLRKGAMVQAKIELPETPASTFFPASSGEEAEIPPGYGSMRLLRTA